MTQVYTTTSLPEAYALRSLLEAHGIEARVVNEGAAFCAVGLPSPALPLCLSVPDERAEEAVRLLSQDRSSEPLTPEDAEFADQVRRSERIGRRGWLAALWIIVLGPLVAGGPILAVVYGDLRPLGAAMVLVGALFVVPVAAILAARHRRRPTSSASNRSA